VIGSLVWHEYWLRHFALPSPNFSGSQKSEIWPTFSTSIAFDGLWFENRARYRKSKAHTDTKISGLDWRWRWHWHVLSVRYLILLWLTVPLSTTNYWLLLVRFLPLSPLINVFWLCHLQMWYILAHPIGLQNPTSDWPSKCVETRSPRRFPLPKYYERLREAKLKTVTYIPSPPNFTEGKVLNLASILNHPMAFEAFWFHDGAATYWKTNLSLGASMNVLCRPKLSLDRSTQL